ncbi:hypothetical protein H9636_17515 [Ureibacillus sp. Re31]|uniref:Uncharacterized protein n=1 Tax=Ureibacillus galli TaxID=2762222 RepID=A0ABR8XGT0_9BACL|nr:hypothetical protein [Ureibacillus galli]MBD8028439.1 hypothetical protein [Ureibacillus galli]
MKFYLIIVLLFYLFWISISCLFPDVSWWSIFSANRSTHTPLMEQVSIIKLTVSILIIGGLGYGFNRYYTYGKKE